MLLEIKFSSLFGSGTPDISMYKMGCLHIYLCNFQTTTYLLARKFIDLGILRCITPFKSSTTHRRLRFVQISDLPSSSKSTSLLRTNNEVLFEIFSS
jgi:hypothetical protein